MDLPAFTAAQALAFVLVMARVGGLFLLAPIFSSKLIPAQAKIVAAVGLSLALTPLATKGRSITDDPLTLASLLVKEIAIGLAFALAVSVLVAAVQAGAALLDAVVGFSFGAIVDPITGIQSAPIAQLYNLFAVMVLLMSGGDRLMIAGLARSYEVVPLGSVPSAGSLAALATTGLVSILVIGLEIVAPVLIAMVVADAAFGLVARAVPQMNVFVVGLPAKIGLALVVMAASMPFVARDLQGGLGQAIVGALQALGG